MARFGCVIINQLDRSERYGLCAFVIVIESIMIITIVIIIISRRTFVYSIPSIFPFVRSLIC